MPTTLILNPVTPLGSFISTGSASGIVSVAGQSADYTISLDAGQVLSSLVTPSAGLSVAVAVIGPSGTLTSLGGTAGQVVQASAVHVATAGDYTIRVTGNGTTGTYTVAATLNAGLEAELSGSNTNGAVATAEDLTAAFFTLGTSPASQAAVIGNLTAPDTTDVYSFTLTTNQRVSLGLLGTTNGSSFTLELMDAGGVVVASGASGSTNLDRVVADYPAQAPGGTYYAKITGSGGYRLVVTRDAGFDREDNSSIAAAQILSGSGRSVGYISNDIHTFENSDFGYTATGLWHLTSRRGSESGHSATTSFWYGREATGTFNNGASNAGTLTSPAITLPSSGSPTLNFNYVLLTEGAGNYDRAEVLISTNNFASSTVLASTFSGGMSLTSAWTAKSLSLAAYLGQTVQIRFAFNTMDNIANDYEGWLIDDVAIGGATGSDYYKFSVNTGDPLTITTQTPFDGPLQPTNTLDPVLELYNPAGTLVASNDNGAADGRNALITHTAASSGVYTVRVTRAGTTVGEYLLGVTGNTGASLANPPIIDSDGGGATANLFPLENNTAVTTVHATDLDPGTTIVYGFGGGADQDFFNINSSTGVVTFKTAPDAENPLDSNHDGVYVVIVTASDGSLIDTQTLFVTVADVNEFPPVITGGLTATVSINENTSFVKTVIATDADRSPSLQYSIDPVTGGADRTRFTMFGNQLYFNSPPDYETPLDTGAINHYEVIVRVFDGNFDAYQTITVIVLNVNEPPILAVPNFSIPENAPIGTVVGNVTATDPEGGAVTLTLSPNSSFALNGSHQLVTTAPINYEQNGWNLLSISAADVALNTSNQNFAVSIGDVTEAPGAVGQQLDLANGGFEATPDLVSWQFFSGSPAGSVQVIRGSDATEGSAFARLSYFGNPSTYTDTFSSSIRSETFAAVAGDQLAADVRALVQHVAAPRVRLFQADGTLVSTVWAPHYASTTDWLGIESAIPTTGNYYVEFQVGAFNISGSFASVSLDVDNLRLIRPLGSVAENQPVGTVVAKLTATNPESSRGQTYSLVSGAGSTDNARFSIVNGELRTAEVFDAGVQTSRSIRLAATANSLTTEQEATIQIIDVAQAPVIISDGGGSTASLNVSENTTAVTQVQAQDPDPGTNLIYSLVQINDWNRFSINPDTGVLTFKIAPNFEAPTDADQNNIYLVTVQASDGVLFGQQALTIMVQDVNDAPVITSHSGLSFVSLSRSENTLLVTDVDATDEDVPAQTLTYSLSGADAGLFQIDSISRVLTFISNPDFEAPADQGHNNVYDVVVTVTDTQGGSDTQTFSITITNVNEFSPTINGLPGSISVPENSAIVVEVNATDLDANTTITYSLTGVDQSKFTINSLSGVISFATGSGNFEFPNDAGGDNIYNVIVNASDGTNVTSQALTVTVTDVNDAPSITSDGGQPTASFSITEEVTTFVTTVVVLDEDIPAQSFTYTLEGVDANLFTIQVASATTATLSFKTPPNYEIPGDNGGDNIYNVIVRVNDGHGGQTTQAIQIQVLNGNDAPVFSGPSALFAPENQTAVGTITANDEDPGTILVFSLGTGGDSDAFNITSGGILSFKNAPNFEAPDDLNHDGVYLVTVRVTDNLFPPVSRVYSVTVTNVNEFTPVFQSGTTASVQENTLYVMTLSATDADLTDTLTYTIIGGLDQLAFDLDSSAGLLTFKTPPDFENPTDNGHNNIYNVRVQVSDGLHSAEQDLVITVLDVNEVPVLTGFTVAPATVNEGSNVTVTVTVANPAMPGLFYEFDLDNNGSFETTSSTPSVIHQFPDNGSYTVRGRAVTTGGTSAIGTATVTVNNVPPTPSILGVPSVAYIGTAINLTATSTDPGTADTVSYTWTVTRAGITIATGAGTSFSFTPTGFTSYTVALTATDDDNGVGTSSVSINVPLLVTSAQDIDDGNYGFGQLSLREAVRLANESTAANTIQFSSSLSGSTITLTQGELVLTDTARTTIVGPGVSFLSISGNNASRVFRIAPGAQATISGLRIIDGNADIGAGLFAEVGSSVDLSQMTFSNNSASQHGGGIAVDRAIANLTGVTLSNNSAVISGGGLYATGTGAIVTVTGSSVTGNSTTGTGGGASVAGGSSVNWISTSFTGNASNSAGGAVIASAGSTTSLTTCTMTSNTAAFGGGGFSIVNGAVLIVTDSVITGNTTAGVGEAVLTDQQSSVTITNSTVSGSVVTQVAIAGGTTYVDENSPAGTFVGQVSITSPVTYPVAFTISAGNIGNAFTIDQTGRITVASGAALDAETRASYTLTVTVTDSGSPMRSGTSTVVVILNDLNEFAPSITSNGGGASASIPVLENTTYVTTVVVSDKDARPTLTFTLSGSDANRFTITAGGVLSFIAAPDYETPLDAGLNNTYDVTVNVSDGLHSVSQNIAVAVQNVEIEAAPSVTGLTPNFGSVAGLNTVTITGTGFTGVTNVKFGATTASFTVLNDTTINATVPAGSGVVNVTVTTSAGTSSNTAADDYTYVTKLTNVVIGDGTGQRSTIRKITLTFNGNIDVGGVGAGSISITNQSDVVIPGLNINVAGAGTNTLVLTFSDTNPNDSVNNFNPPNYGTPASTGPVTFGSLVDGLYRLKLNGATLLSGGVAVDIDANGTAGGTRNDDFHRLFGDKDGDHTVGTFDYFPSLINAINKELGEPGFNSAWDYDNDGVIGSFDFFPHLVNRFNAEIF